jgi:drug/metabolite transporter (DMT)-like permease
MEHVPPSISTRAGTAGGTLLVLLNINGEEILKTVVMAAVGAAVSFAVSYLLQRLVKRWPKR